MTNQHIEQHITVSEERSAVDLLSQETGLSKTVIKQTMQKGAVWLTHNTYTQRLRRAKKQLQIGDELHIYYDEKILNETTLPAELIADEQAHSVWFKPYGMRSQGSKWGDHTTIQRWAESHLTPQRPTFTVHRLDRAATGLILIAHKKQTATALSKCFENHTIEKKYRVITHGQFPETSQTYTDPIDNRHAHTQATLIRYEPSKNHSLLEITIETGRKHQIRRHVSHAGYPIVGDRLYGSSDQTTNLQLTAYSLAFQCPETSASKSYQLPDTHLPIL
jgi:tRNA pseudouridine32 synthase / 23S rRNA pseudouridine746 synthase